MIAVDRQREAPTVEIPPIVNRSILHVSVSGGRDSTATALALRDAGLDAAPVFWDTGWEHEATYDYVDRVLPEILAALAIVALRGWPGESSVDDLDLVAGRLRDVRGLDLRRVGDRLLVDRGRASARVSLEGGALLVQSGGATTLYATVPEAVAAVLEVTREDHR